MRPRHTGKKTGQNALDLSRTRTHTHIQHTTHASNNSLSYTTHTHNTHTHLEDEANTRVAEGAERTAIWDQMVSMYPPFGDYKVAAGDREIPVIVLEPIR